jgi:hypothetical protein
MEEYTNLMDVDFINMKEFNLQSLNFHKNRLNQVELRIQNDLLDIKKNRMSTKMFSIKMSDIVKDENNSIFSMNLVITSLDNMNMNINSNENYLSQKFSFHVKFINFNTYVK